MITFDTYWLTVVVAVVLPAVVALVTKRVASGTVKALTLSFLSLVAATLTQILNSGGSFDWQLTLRDFVVTFVIAVCVHFGLLKPMSITGSEGRIQAKFTGGIG